MILQKQDLRMLRLPAALAVLLIGLGAGIMIASEKYLESARASRSVAEKQRAEAQDRVSKASEEEKEIRSHLIYFDRMAKQGLIGTRDRLDLIDTITGIKTQRKLIDIKYDIQPQQLVEYPGIVRTGSMDFYSSKMQLDMRLLHEEDLLNFVNDLQAAGQALFSMRQCKLNKMERPAGTALAPGLQADCTLDVINLVDTAPK